MRGGEHAREARGGLREERADGALLHHAALLQHHGAVVAADGGDPVLKYSIMLMFYASSIVL